MPAPEGAPVLVVESDESDAKLVEESFRTHGWPVIRARTAEEALRLLRAADVTPRCVLLDLRLSGPMSGFDLLRAFHEGEGTRATPVIVYTGEYTRDDLVQAFALGASSVIKKPVDSPARVVAMVEFFLGELDDRLRQARVTTRRQFVELRSRAEAPPGPSDHPGRIRSA